VQASVPGKDLPVTYSIADRGGDYATALALFTVNATSGRIAVKSSLPVSGILSFHLVQLVLTFILNF
jgi:hypothetical protein